MAHCFVRATYQDGNTTNGQMVIHLNTTNGARHRKLVDVTNSPFGQATTFHEARNKFLHLEDIINFECPHLGCHLAIKTYNNKPNITDKDSMYGSRAEC